MELKKTYDAYSYESKDRTHMGDVIVDAGNFWLHGKEKKVEGR